MTKMSQKEIIKYLKTEKIRVSVFGEFSTGKTTFLNALINEEILTVAYEPTTAVPTRIRYGRLFNIFVEPSIIITFKGLSAQYAADLIMHSGL